MEENLELDIRIRKEPDKEYEVTVHSKDLNSCLWGLAQTVADIGAQTGLGAQKILCQLAVLVMK